jgi:CubicO group peptidase (beta-lactamase class C family)
LARAHLAPLVSDGAVPWLAWAVVRDEDTAAGGFGGAAPETSFQIGSVTKVFTALLLADMAERGEVHLSDPAAGYLPGPAQPGLVALADLATHTSGLPRLPRDLLFSALLHPADPYARYPVARLVRAARRALRAGSPGSPYAYSNFGFGLLGYLLGQAAGTPYESLVTTRICVPLGLSSTTVAVPDPCRAAQGHRRDRTIAWHNGMTGGFSAMIALDPAGRLGVAALANAAGPPPSPLDRAVLSAFGP